MDYTCFYENVSKLGITNFDASYILYYDETNNPRKFCLTQEGFNVNEREFFILGGIGFENVEAIENLEIDQLLCGFKVQKNTNEIKFKHIKGKSKNLTELILQKRVQILIDWIIEKKAFIHYSYIDNFYYSIVDIVDTIEESFFGGPEFQREIKDSLYSLIKKNQAWFINLLITHDYPNIKNHNLFIIEVVGFIWRENIHEDFYLEYLRQSLKSYREKNLILLENNEDGIAIDNYYSFYINSIVNFSESTHIFDSEKVIEKKIGQDSIVIQGRELQNYRFVDSKSEILVQISDLVVGIIRYWMMLLEEKNLEELWYIFNNLSTEETKYFSKLQQIMLDSLGISTGFKYGIGSNTFEIKISYFLEFDF